MSWFFYVCIIAAVCVFLTWLLIYPLKIVCQHDKGENFAGCVVLICMATMLFFLIRGVECEGVSGQKRLCLDNSSNPDAREVIVYANTILLDGIWTYQLQPGEYKALSAFAGGYTKVSTRVLKTTCTSHKRNIAEKYEELIKD